MIINLIDLPSGSPLIYGNLADFSRDLDASINDDDTFSPQQKMGAYLSCISHCASVGGQYRGAVESLLKNRLFV